MSDKPTLSQLMKAAETLSDVFDTIPCPACEDGSLRITLEDGSVFEDVCPMCDGTQQAPDISKIKSAFMEALDE